MKKTFSIKKLFTESWSDYKSHWKLFILIGIIFSLVGLLGNLGGTINTATGMISHSPFVGVITWALRAFITLGFIKFLLNIIDKKEAKIEQLFNGATTVSHYISFLVVSLLVLVLLGILMIPFAGSFFLYFASPVWAWITGIVFGIIAVTVFVGLIFARYLAAEEKTGIFESLRESWKGTRPYQWKILLFILATLIFNILGGLAFIIGLIITIPMTTLMYARLYREIFDCECVDGVCNCKPESTDDNHDIIVEEIIDGDHTEEKEKDTDSKGSDNDDKNK